MPTQSKSSEQNKQESDGGVRQAALNSEREALKIGKIGAPSTIQDEQLHVVQGNLAREAVKDAVTIEKSLMPPSQTENDIKKSVALRAAVRDGSVANVKSCLEYNADVNIPNEKGETTLHLAVMYAGVDILTLLLAAGADPNVKNSAEGCTPLDLELDKLDQCDELCMDRAKLLIEHGARLSHWKPEKMIERCASAIRRGIRDLVEIFLKSGCDPNGSIEEEQLTLLGVAARSGQVEIGELLLDHGASASTEPSPLMLALRHKHLRLVELFLRRGAQDSLSGSQKKCCLRIAALEAEMDVDSRKQMIQVLLQNGINIDAAIDSSFNTVLHAAVQNDNLELIQMLVDLGADVNSQNRNGLTPLVLACRNNNITAARIFIRSGRADLSRGTSTGSHPLVEAIENKRGDLVKELLISGAPVNLARDDRVSPLKLAVAKSDEAVVKMLLLAGADVHYNAEGLLIAAIKNDNPEVVRLLIRAGIDVAKEDTDGPRAVSKIATGIRAPLMVAVREGSFYTIVETLLQAGAPVNAVDAVGNTVLHIAASKGQTELVRILLSYGANASIRNVSGMTARIMAARQHFRETVEVLDSHESSLRSKDDHESFSTGTITPEADQAWQFLVDVEDSYLCPITHEIMRDPVLAPDGHSYERSEIIAWIEMKGCSPMTRQEMVVGDLIPSFTLKRQIEAFSKAFPEGL